MFPKIYKILIEDRLVEYVKERGLEKQLKKSFQYLLEGNVYAVHLKARQPKSQGIYYFRINKQFRALCTFQDGVLKIFSISNHQ